MSIVRHKACLLLAVVGCATAAVHAQTDSPQSALKEDSPRTGSIIRKEVAWSSIIPLNRTYSQLTVEEKQALHASYESVAPGDEPPFPLEGLKPIVSAITKAQENLLATGELRLIVTVNPDGKAREVTAYGSVDVAEMTRFAASVLVLTKYKPAICGGKPCAMQFPFHLKLAPVKRTTEGSKTATVSIRVLGGEKCQAFEMTFPCQDVVAALMEAGVSKTAPLQLRFVPGATLAEVLTLMSTLQAAGFTRVSSNIKESGPNDS